MNPYIFCCTYSGDVPKFQTLVEKEGGHVHGTLIIPSYNAQDLPLGGQYCILYSAKEELSMAIKTPGMINPAGNICHSARLLGNLIPCAYNDLSEEMKETLRQEVIKELSLKYS